MFKHGDIIGIKGTGLFSFLVSLGEFIHFPWFGSEYKYTHVGIVFIYNGIPKILEALSDGVKIQPINKYKHFTVKRLRVLSSADIDKLGACIFDYSKKKISYNWFQIIWLGAAKLLRMEWVANPFRSKRSMICSELVDRIYRDAIGFRFNCFEVGNIDPKQIMDDDRFYELMEV